MYLEGMFDLCLQGSCAKRRYLGDVFWLLSIAALHPKRERAWVTWIGQIPEL